MLLLAWLAWAPATAASPEAEVERLADEAVKAYRAQSYPRAIERYQRAYAIRPVAALLYNLARVYEKSGDLEAARATYRRFLAAPDADAALKGKAEARLAVLDAAAAAPAPLPEPAAPPPSASIAPTPPAPAPAATAGPIAPAPAATAAPGPDRARRRALYRRIALGSGVATLACGIVAVGLSSSALALEHENRQSVDLDRKTELRHDAFTQAGVGDVFYIATGVGAVVTATFLYLGFRPARRAVALLPSAGPGALGLAAAGRF